MGAFDFQRVFAQIDVTGAIFLGLDDQNLIAVSGETGLISTFGLQGSNAPQLLDSRMWGDDVIDVPPSDGELSNEGSLWLWSHLDGRVWIDGADDVTGQLVDQPLVISAMVQMSSGAYIIAPHGHDQLMLINGEDGEFSRSATISDDAKLNIANPSDLLSVNVGTTEFLIASSHSESGISSFRVDDQGFTAVDSIGQKDGMWTLGVSTLKTCDVEGTTYVLALSSESDSIVSLRLNDLGVFFKTDQIWDTRDTRFSGATDFEIFEWSGRDFIVAGGQDLGLSLIEVLPDGTLFHHQSIEQSASWSVGPITQIEVAMGVETAHFFVTGSQEAGIAQLTLDLSSTGGRQLGDDGDNDLSGGWMDDILIGGAGNDYLIGKAGDDILIDGSGEDILEGENGDDIFVFQSDGQLDKIKDFLHGEDRIHLGGWGRIYDYSALEIERTSSGARISWGNEVLEVFSKDRQPIEVSEWGADDFIF